MIKILCQYVDLCSWWYMGICNCLNIIPSHNMQRQLLTTSYTFFKFRAPHMAYCLRCYNQPKETYACYNIIDMKSILKARNLLQYRELQGCGKSFALTYHKHGIVHLFWLWTLKDTWAQCEPYLQGFYKPHKVFKSYVWYLEVLILL